MEDGAMGGTPSDVRDERNTRRKFATPAKLTRGQKIYVFIRSEDPGRFVAATALGRKNKRGDHMVRVKKGHRAFEFGARPRDILVAW